MKFASILELATVKTVMQLSKKEEIRYNELDKVTRSRGTLTLTLRELQGEGLLERRVVVSRPIQSYYSLSRKGKKVAQALSQLQDALSGN